MKLGQKQRKRMILGAAILAFLLLLILVALRVGGSLLQKHHISYTSLSYHFPASLTVEGLQAEPTEEFQLRLETLEFTWSWGSLIKGKPSIKKLHLHQGRISLRSGQEKSQGEPSSLPRLSFSQVLLEDVAVELLSEEDSLRFHTEQLYLSSASAGDRILVDTLQLRRPSLSYTRGGKEIPDTSYSTSDSQTSFSLESVPGFEINFLHLKQGALQLKQEGSDQHLDSLELALSGWKSTDLLNVGVQRLGFVYQDTLRIDLVLESGELNREFKADLSDFGVELQGASLKIEHARADLKQGAEGRLLLAPSYLSLGRIRQVYSAIDSILHPRLPDSTKIHFSGEIELHEKKVALHSMEVWVLDSTSMELNGTVSLYKEPLMEVNIRPFLSTRSNLVRLLARQNYHRFYLWPHEIDGEIRVQGSPSDLGFYGSLDSREGRLMAESHVQSDSLGGLFFSLDIWSDSVYVSGITDLLPLPVPRGQLRFYLEMKNDGQQEITPLWIAITSDSLFAFDRYIRNIEFAYYGDAQLDSMHGALNDTIAKLMVDLSTPTDGDGTTYFTGSVDQIFPACFNSSLPGGFLSTQLNGAYLFKEEETELTLDLVSLCLKEGEHEIFLPDSHLEMLGRGDRISVNMESQGRSVLRAQSGTVFPEFALPLPEWFSKWPDTEVELRLDMKEDLLAYLTGNTGRLVLESFKLEKDSNQWSLHASFPEISYGEHNLEEIHVELNSNYTELQGQLSLESYTNESFLVNEVSAFLGYGNNQYSFELENRDSDLLGRNRMAILTEELEQGFRLRFNDAIPLLINNEPWQVGVNRGVELDSLFRLVQGDLGIRRGSSRLEAVTQGQSISLYLDSLELEPLLAYLSDGDLVRGQLNAELRLSTPGMDVTWDAGIIAYTDYLPDPAQIDLEGVYQDGDLEARVKFTHEEASASGEIHKSGEAVDYSIQLNRMDVDVLTYLPDFPSDLKVSGRLSGLASGSLGKEISANGYLIADSLNLIPPVTGSALSVDRDTLILKGNELFLNDFRIRDANKHFLSLQGAIRFYPELEGELRVKSEQFALLQHRAADSRLSGTLLSRTDLTLKGGRDHLSLTGSLETLPGAELTYRSAKSFKMVDASQIVTFMELDESGEGAMPVSKPSKLGINWDVDLQLDESIVEVVLDEITQEYIQIQAKGSLQLKSGVDQMPMVYGTLTSSEGRAYIKPPAIPELDLVIEDAAIHWKGLLDDPLISFRGYKIIKGLTSGLYAFEDGSGQLVDYRVFVILDEATLSEFDLRFDLEVEDSEAQILLASLPPDTRQAYALNLLVFGRLGTEKIKGNSMLANQVTRKLNELSRRNLKHTGLSFSSANYTDKSDGRTERDRTDLSYSLSRGFLNNRLKVAVGGSVGFYMDDMTMLPPSNLIGDLELSYRLSDRPTLILKGTRKNVYEGIIDGMVTEESLGLVYQKSYSHFPLLPGRKKDQDGGTKE